MSEPWLDTYYGEKWRKALSPVVIISGKSYAVLRLSSPGEVVHVLVNKAGRHNVSSHEVLLVGMAGSNDYERMRQRLLAVDHQR